MKLATRWKAWGLSFRHDITGERAIGSALAWLACVNIWPVVNIWSDSNHRWEKPSVVDWSTVSLQQPLRSADAAARVAEIDRLMTLQKDCLEEWARRLLVEQQVTSALSQSTGVFFPSILFPLRPLILHLTIVGSSMHIFPHGT